MIHKKDIRDEGAKETKLVKIRETVVWDPKDLFKNPMTYQAKTKTDQEIPKRIE